jgi:hypothetical protein
MLTMDPPRHTALRALVSKGFTPRQVAKLNERITDMARDVVDSVIEGASATSSPTSPGRCPHTSSPNCSAFRWKTATGFTS